MKYSTSALGLLGHKGKLLILLYRCNLLNCLPVNCKRPKKLHVHQINFHFCYILKVQLFINSLKLFPKINFEIYNAINRTM